MTRDKDVMVSITPTYYNCHKRRKRRRGWHKGLPWGYEMAVSCLHPHLSRLKADGLLKSAAQDGSYLIRNSESLTGVYILCLLCEGRVHQYRIMKNEENGLIYIPAESASNQREYFDLPQLIHELSQRGDKNGLRCAMRHPINRLDTEDDSEEEDEGGNRSSASSGFLSSSSSSQTLSSCSPSSVTSPVSPLSPPGGACPTLPVAQQAKRRPSQQATATPETDVTKYLMKRFTNLDLSSQDGQFINDVRNYVDDGINSDIRGSFCDGPLLKQLLISNSAPLQRQAQDFRAKISLLNTVFGLPGSQSKTTSLDKDIRSFEVLDIAKDLEQCAQMLTTFHTQATDYIKELQSKQVRKEKTPFITSLARQEKASDLIPEKAFRVAGSKLGKFTEKIDLRVNIMSGKVHICKLERSKIEDYTHDKVEQVVKWLDNNQRLNIRFTGKNKMNAYEFTDVWQRETFCQYISRMKKQHMAGQDIDDISIFVGTWNMGSDPPPCDLNPWFQSQGTGKTRDEGLSVIGHDLYIIGTQESALNEKEWISKIKENICKSTNIRELHLVACVSSWSIRMVVLVKAEYKNKVTRVMTDSVKTGIANTLGNKGGVGVSFSFDGTTLCFVNCHLTSGHERNARRNQNAHDIIKGLSGLKPKGSLPACDIISQFHHVFFLGDLNYRLEDEDPSKIVTMIQREKMAKNQNYSTLLKLDQLKKTQERKEAFIEFNEDEILFPPTYRIVKGTRDRYDYQKFKATGLRINAPSWCDRVLLHSYPETYQKWTSYGCVEDIMSSDHKPVFSSFDIGIISSQASRGSDNNMTIQNVKIIFQEVFAELRSSSKFTSQIDFFSSCLQSVVSSKPNTEFVSGNNNEDLCCHKWSCNTLPPPLLPLFDDREYIADQHLIICVKNVDSQESYGECVLSLKSMISVKPEPFNCRLTHNGEETGSIRGFMHVQIQDVERRVSSARRRKSYEYVVTEPLSQTMKQFSKLSIIQDTEEPPPQPTGPMQKSTSFDSACATTIKREPSRRSGPPGSGVAGSDCVNNNGQDGRSRSRPRMGQSSLSAGAVLPVSGRHSTPPIGQDDNQNPWTNPKDGTVKRHAQSGECARPMAVYDNTQNVTLVATTLRQVPLRNNQADPNYDTLKPPVTVNEWLLDLGLPEYIPTFFSEGWDSMNYVIKDLSPGDLDHMDIKHPKHVKRIMESLSDMRKNQMM